MRTAAVTLMTDDRRASFENLMLKFCMYGTAPTQDMPVLLLLKAILSQLGPKLAVIDGSTPGGCDFSPK